MRTHGSWTPWSVGWPAAAKPFPTVRSLIIEAQARLRATLTAYEAVPDGDIEPLVHALFQSDSVTATLAGFRLPATLSPGLTEALELVVGIGAHEGGTDND